MYPYYASRLYGRSIAAVFLAEGAGRGSFVFFENSDKRYVAGKAGRRSNGFNIHVRRENEPFCLVYPQLRNVVHDRYMIGLFKHGGKVRIADMQFFCNTVGTEQRIRKISFYDFFCMLRGMRFGRRVFFQRPYAAH